MKRLHFPLLTIFVIILVVSGCKQENAELKKEAKVIAEAMCRSIETMNKLESQITMREYDKF